MMVFETVAEFIDDASGAETAVVSTVFEDLAADDSGRYCCTNVVAKTVIGKTNRKNRTDFMMIRNVWR